MMLRARYLARGGWFEIGREDRFDLGKVWVRGNLNFTR